MSSVEASVELVQKPQDDCAVLADCKLPEVPVIVFAGHSMSLHEGKLHVRQLLGAQCPIYLQKSSAAAREKLGSMELLSSVLDAEGDWDLANLTKGPELGSHASICSRCWRPRETCSVDFKCVLSLVADLLSLKISSMEAINRPSVMEVRVGALEATLSSSNMSIWKLQSQLSSKNSELDGAAAELESFERRLQFAEYAATLMRDLVQSQRHQLCEGETHAFLPRPHERVQSETFSRILHQSWPCRLKSSANLVCKGTCGQSRKYAKSVIVTW